MGKKLDALLGRSSFKPGKLKPLVNLAINRLSVLKKRRLVLVSQAKSDVVQLLVLTHHEQALLRVEQVIKEQNMVDVYVMLEGFCLVLMERVNLFEHEKECPDELKEAVSSLIFASSRCGDLPEIQDIRVILTSRYGKEFVARAVELRNDCGVNVVMIQKLSTKIPGLESRMLALKEIASENGITLNLVQISMPKEKTQNVQDRFSVKDGSFSSSMKPEKYRDVAHAAQVAFESAAYAAVAARAAVELSKSSSQGPNDHNDKFGSDTKANSFSNDDRYLSGRAPNLSADSTEALGARSVPTLNLERKILSMRTRGVNVR